MRASEFERLSDDLCALLSVSTVKPQQRQAGLWLVMLELQGVDFYLLHAPEVDASTASLVVEFGPLPRANELQGWLDLLDANHLSRGALAPRFCRDAETGQATLQCAFGIADVSAVELHAKLLAMVHMAHEWRRRQAKQVQ